MVTTPPSIDDVEDVIQFIPSNDFEYYDHLDKDEIREGHVCGCGHEKFGRSGDRLLYSGDKTAINVCADCGGFYSFVLNNW